MAAPPPINIKVIFLHNAMVKEKGGKRGRKRSEEYKKQKKKKRERREEERGGKEKIRDDRRMYKIKEWGISIHFVYRSL